MAKGTMHTMAHDDSESIMHMATHAALKAIPTTKDARGYLDATGSKATPARKTPCAQR